MKQAADRPIDLQIVGLPDDPTLFERFARAGYSRVVMWLPSAHRSLVESRLDGYDRAIADFNGE